MYSRYYFKHLDIADWYVEMTLTSGDLIMTLTSGDVIMTLTSGDVIMTLTSGDLINWHNLTRDGEAK